MTHYLGKQSKKSLNNTLRCFIGSLRLTWQMIISKHINPGTFSLKHRVGAWPGQDKILQ